MARIPISEVYCVSKHVKNSNQRGVLRFNQSPSMSRIPINEVYFVSEVHFVVGPGLGWVSQACQEF